MLQASKTLESRAQSRGTKRRSGWRDILEETWFRNGGFGAVRTIAGVAWTSVQVQQRDPAFRAAMRAAIDNPAEDLLVDVPYMDRKEATDLDPADTARSAHPTSAPTTASAPGPGPLSHSPLV
jgi:hypothetical protein